MLLSSGSALARLRLAPHSAPSDGLIRLRLYSILAALLFLLVTLPAAIVQAHHLPPPPDLPPAGVTISSPAGSGGGVRVQAAAADAPCNSRFSDVAPSHAACPAIRLLADKGIVSGYPDGTYRPDRPITRAEFAKLLTGAMGLPPQPNAPLDFTDTAGHWAATGGYLQVAKEPAATPSPGMHGGTRPATAKKPTGTTD